MSRRLSIAVIAILCLALAGGLSGGAAAAPAGADGGPTAEIAKKKRRGARRCPRGKKLVTRAVRRNGRRRRVKRCVRRAARRPAARQPAPDAPGDPAGTPGQGPTFEAPGQRLEGEAAKPFLQRYLVSSRFTDCPAGWPACAVEERYSHFPDGSFFYCRLTPTSGSDITFGSEYQVLNAVVEADGSWAFDEVVPVGGNPSYYEWHVAVNGAVTGLYRGPSGDLQQLGPLQYVGVPANCSY